MASHVPSIDDCKTLDDIEFTLKRGSVYLGSFEKSARSVFTYSLEQERLVQQQIETPESLERVFLEVLGNASDNVQRSRDAQAAALQQDEDGSCYDPRQIEVTVDATTVSVTNYGRWIPVEKTALGIYYPENIFGVFRSGSNYDDDDTRVLIGQNGLGAKATNVFSSRFEVVCVDPKNGLRYEQAWTDNMRDVSEPKITKTRVKRGSVCVTYTPDFPRFGVGEFSAEDIAMYAAHCVATSFTCQIPVLFNGKRLHVKTIDQYSKLLFDTSAKGGSVVSHSGDGYELCIADTPNRAVCLSFVNGVTTALGGVHLNAAKDCVMEAVKEVFKRDKDLKGAKFRRPDLDQHVSVIISCRLPNPRFKGQTKEYLTAPTPKIELPQKLQNKMKRWDLIGVLRELVESKLQKKIDGSERQQSGRGKRIDDDKASDANKAGKGQSKKCTLILTEGDSALQYAHKFIGLFPDKKHGRDYYGMIPLKGVPLNAYNASAARFAANKEMDTIKRFMGLKEKLDYSKPENLTKLRYGNIWIMVDADTDGKHIAGLLLLYFMHKFPGLVEQGMIHLFRTPIVRATKGKLRRKFYTETAFNRWYAGGDKLSDREAVADRKGWSYSYYKGLASSKPVDIKEDFGDTNIVRFEADKQAMETLLKVFDKKRPNDRKQWVMDFVDESLGLENAKEIPVSTFIDQEMISHAFATIARGIPQIDGFKEALRKAFFTANSAFNKSKEIKVSHLGNAAAERCNYKYGETSLMDSIGSAAMQFPGSNNEPIFKDEGIIGSRNTGQNESAPRYIKVSRIWWSDLLFRKEDECIMEQLVDEGQLVEYRTYYPVMPTLLFNHTSGIGTAYSTEIPCYYPPQLAAWILARMTQGTSAAEPTPELVPWYRGHTGTIHRREDGFTSYGRFRKQGHNIIVEELPVRVWTKDYESFLSELKSGGVISEFLPTGCDSSVGFILEGWNKRDKAGKLVAPTLKNLKLAARFSTKNMTILLPDEHGHMVPVTHDSVDDILEYYYGFRLNAYWLRRREQLKLLRADIEKTSERQRFIEDVISGRLPLHNVPLAQITARMRELGYPEDSKLLDQVTSRHYTKDELARLTAKIEGLEQDHTELKKSTPAELWKREIHEYLAEYEKRNGPTKMPSYAEA